MARKKKKYTKAQLKRMRLIWLKRARAAKKRKKHRQIFFLKVKDKTQEKQGYIITLLLTKNALRRALWDSF